MLPRFVLGIDVVGLWRAYVCSAALCITVSSGERLGSCVLYEKISIVSETRSEAFLGVYDVRQQ